MQLGYPYPKRLKLLQELRKSVTGKTHGIRFQGKFEHMQIYSVPIDLPKYRLKNGRTAAAQIEYLATHPKVTRDIFSRDPELLEAQAIQHSILKGMVNEEGLYTYFKNHEQEVPLILTNTGFIVNGNRRICAMRELYYSEQKKDYNKFKNIDVIILPPCTEEEIDWLEGKEQIHQDITADYSWVTTAVMYRTRMNEHNQDVKYVANLYEVNKGDVTEMIDMLAHAEAYLKDRGKEGQYSLVEGDEYAFRQLRKFRPSLNNEAKKQVYDQIVYTIIDNSEGDRAYKAVADAAKYFDQVVESIQSEFQLKPDGAKQGKARLLGGAKATPATAIMSLFRDAGQRNKVRDVIRDAIAAQNEKTREKQKANFLLSQVRRAQNALNDAVEAISDESSKEGVDVLLTAIDQSVGKLRKWLNAKAKN